MNRRTPTSVLVLALAITIGAISASPASAGHDAENPTWDPGYRVNLAACDPGEYVELHWQLVLPDGLGRFDDAADHRVHSFLRPSGSPGYDYTNLHWNVQPESIKSTKVDSQGRGIVTWQAIYPTENMLLHTAWVDLDGEAEDGDELRLLAVAPCRPSQNQSLFDRWGAVEGNPAHTH